MATRYRFSVEEFERLFQGVPRVELIRGEVYQTSPQGPKHAHAVVHLDRTLQQTLGDVAVIAVQIPLRLGGETELEPDLMVLKPGWAEGEGLPGPEDVLLVIEVAQTSLAYDREAKLPLYAEAGIPEVWLVNLAEEILEVYRGPQGNRYRLRELVPKGEAKAPLAFPERSIPWG